MRNDSFKPECVNHPIPAIGGELREMIDEWSATFVFQCGSCGPPTQGWAVVVANMLTWVPAEKIAPGIYRCRRLA